MYLHYSSVFLHFLTQSYHTNSEDFGPFEQPFMVLFSPLSFLIPFIMWKRVARILKDSPFAEDFCLLFNFLLYYSFKLLKRWFSQKEKEKVQKLYTHPHNNTLTSNTLVFLFIFIQNVQMKSCGKTLWAFKISRLSLSVLTFPVLRFFRKIQILMRGFM